MITFREELKPGELEILHKIELSCFGVELSWDLEGLAEALDCGDYVIAEADGEVVGFIVGDIEDTGPNIVTIDIHQDWRGKGLGTQLMEIMEKKYKDMGYTSITLQVRVNNPARYLYLRRGYTTQKLLSFYYQDGGAALQMSKPL